LVAAHRFEPAIFQVLVRIDTTQSVLRFDAVVSSGSRKDVVKTEATVRSLVFCTPQTSSQDPVEPMHTRVTMRVELGIFNSRNFSDCSKRSERTQFAGLSEIRIYCGDGRNIFLS